MPGDARLAVAAPGPAHPPITLPHWAGAVLGPKTAPPERPTILLTDSAGRNAEDLLAAAWVVAGTCSKPETPAFRFDDDRRDPRQGARIAGRAAGQGVDAVVGHFSSSVAIAAAPHYAARRIAFFSPSASSDALRGHADAPVFTIFPRDSALIDHLTGHLLGQALGQLPGQSHAVDILGQSGNNGAALAAALTAALSMKSVPAACHIRALPDRPEGAVDWLAEVSRDKVLVVLGSAEFMRAALRRLPHRAAKAIVLADDAQEDPAARQEAERLAVPVHVCAPRARIGPVLGHDPGALLQQGTKRLGRPPGPYFLNAVFALLLLIDQARHGPLHAPALCRRLMARAWDGPFGTLRFAADGGSTGADWALHRLGEVRA